MQKLLILCLSLLAVNSFAQAVGITFLTEKSWKSPSSGTMQYAADKEASVFQAVGPAAPVYVHLDFINPPLIKAKDRIQLQVMKKTAGGEEFAFEQTMRIPNKSGKLNIKSNFTPGEYIARLVDKDNTNDIYGTGNFEVRAANANSRDYKHNSKFYACKSVGDDWNPVGETTTIKAGSCIQFLYKADKSQDKIDHYFMYWSIRRIKADGTEDYVNDLQHNAGDDPWRFLATGDVCEFSKPGTYRIYLFDKETLDSHHGVSEEYYGKMELTVQ